MQWAAIEGHSDIGQPPTPAYVALVLPLHLGLERGFDCPVRRLDRDHARCGIVDRAALAGAFDLRTLFRELASAQD
jgi:hypothetical protein